MISDEKRNKYLLKKYGISLDQYNEILKKQNNACAICKRDRSNFKNNLAVDHDHKTGEVRGLLCFYDNKRFVGRHTKDTVRKLIAYLLPGWRVVKNKMSKS